MKSENYKGRRERKEPLCAREKIPSRRVSLLFSKLRAIVVPLDISFFTPSAAIATEPTRAAKITEHLTSAPSSKHNQQLEGGKSSRNHV